MTFPFLSVNRIGIFTCDAKTGGLVAFDGRVVVVKRQGKVTDTPLLFSFRNLFRHARWNGKASL